MNKKLIGAIIFAYFGMASAQSDVCNYSTDFNININEQSVLFKKTAGDSYEFKDEVLLINGKAAELNSEQLAASKALQKNARLMVPKIAVVAVEGAELGVKAAALVMGALFSDDPAAQKELMQPIEAISEKIKKNINNTQLNTEALEKSLEDAFDEEFEQAMEIIVTKYSGKIIGNIMSSIFSGDKEEINDLEFRLENMEQDIEKYVEANADALKVKAEALCDDMVIIDKMDDLLESVKGYPKDGLIQKDKDHGFKLSHFSLNNKE